MASARKEGGEDGDEEEEEADKASKSGRLIKEQNVHVRCRSQKMAVHRCSARRVRVGVVA